VGAQGPKKERRKKRVVLDCERKEAFGTRSAPVLPYSRHLGLGRWDAGMPGMAWTLGMPELLPGFTSGGVSFDVECLSLGSRYTWGGGREDGQERGRERERTMIHRHASDSCHDHPLTRKRTKDTQTHIHIMKMKMKE
jgi:hypothetical protein